MPVSLPPIGLVLSLSTGEFSVCLSIYHIYILPFFYHDQDSEMVAQPDSDQTWTFVVSPLDHVPSRPCLEARHMLATASATTSVEK